MCRSEPLSLLLDTAIPCGLIVNELLSNALKHAFPENQPGEITIRVFQNDAGYVVLSVADNGVGVPPGFEFRSQTTLGLQTIFAIAEQQMQGQVRFTSEQGVTCTVEFPDTLYTERV
jgi:two-component sensor histidine kinase